MTTISPGLNTIGSLASKPSGVRSGSSSASGGLGAVARELGRSVRQPEPCARGWRAEPSWLQHAPKAHEGRPFSRSKAKEAQTVDAAYCARGGAATKREAVAEDSQGRQRGQHKNHIHSVSRWGPAAGKAGASGGGGHLLLFSKADGFNSIASFCFR